MKFDDAVKRSIKAFRAGELPRAVEENMEEELRYTPEFFDDIEKELDLGDVDDDSN